MSKKNRVALAAAIAAMVILIGSGVARCAMTPAPEPQDTQPQETAARISGSEQSDAPQGAERPSNETQRGDCTIESLVGTTWTAEDDPASTLALIQGTLVEGTGADTKVTYYTVDDEQAQDSSLICMLSASTSPTEAARQSIIKFTYEDGLPVKVESDLLSHAYVIAKGDVGDISFANVTSQLEESMGANAAAIEASVASRAKAISPTAKTASWDKEVWVDFAANTATTTFTLDDGAPTIISVTRTADGAVEAL